MCTRVFWGTQHVAKVAGRTLDWEVDDEPMLWCFPPGIARDGRVDGAARWESRHRSLAMSFWGAAASDGVNDAGLAAHLALEDASGDSAVVEYVDGATVVHHGSEFAVMANDPTYDEQLAGLSTFRPWGGDAELPGDIVSADRFARATYFLEHLPTPRDEREAVAGVLGVARNVAVPFGAPYDDFSVYPTWWVSVVDPTNATYYFSSTLAPNVVWADLRNGPLAATTTTLAVDPRDAELVGDLGASFAPATPPY
jgi:choloylglycine hydrolase